MSATDHLNERQFRIPMEDLRNARSSDFGVPMHEVMPHLEAEWRNYQRNGWPEPHPGHERHGGPRGYVDHLKQDIAENGLRTPPLINDENHPYVVDGHHRAIALMEMGGEDAPAQRPMTFGKIGKVLPRNRF